MSTIFARILQSTGLASSLGSILPREFGITIDTERPAIGSTAGGPKYIGTEEVINITTTAPAALSMLRRSLTLIFVDTTTAGGNVNLDISAGAQIAGYRCRIFVNGPDTRQAIVDYGPDYEYIVNGYSQEFVWSGSAWMKTQGANSDRYLIGQVIDSLGEDTPTAKTPIVKLWDSDHDLANTSYPLLVPYLRDQVAQVWNGSAYVSSFSVTIAAGVATGSGTAWTNLLASLLEDELVNGGYANWRCGNIGGADYPITNVNIVAGTLTFSGSPPTGSQTMYYFPHRIAGLPGSARVFKDSGRALMSIDGVKLCASNRRRNYVQGHFHGIITSSSGAGGGALVTNAFNATPVGVGFAYANAAITDGAHGTPRIGSDTEPNSTPIYRYIWAGVQI